MFAEPWREVPDFGFCEFVDAKETAMHYHACSRTQDHIAGSGDEHATADVADVPSQLGTA